MTVEEFIKAMPKVALDVRLEGIFRRETLMVIADQNEIAASTKNFPYWMELLEHPEYDRLPEITEQVSQWLQQPDDLTRLVYDAGVILSRQNVKYAEIAVSPSLFMLNQQPFDEFMEALNDGRERAERGWKIQMRWILSVSRDEPRRADEVVRWATSAVGRKGGVVGLALHGDSAEQPVGQFERAFSMAEKKGLPRVAQTSPTGGAEEAIEMMDNLLVSRLVDGRGAADAPNVLSRLASSSTALTVSVARGLCHNWYADRSVYPMRELVDNVPVVIGTDMPTYYKTSLVEEYLGAVEHNGLEVDDIEKIALNAIRHSFLPEDERVTLRKEHEAEFAKLREQLASEPESQS